MIKGAFRADGIALMEIEGASFLSGAANPKMRAKMAFVRTETGATLGWTVHENWSKETLTRLAALREAMEQDVADLYMYQTGGAATTPGGAPTSIPLGIADHLGADEIPSF